MLQLLIDFFLFFLIFALTELNENKQASHVIFTTIISAKSLSFIKVKIKSTVNKFSKMYNW